jgi:putative flippase GtrA
MAVTLVQVGLSSYSLNAYPGKEETRKKLRYASLSVVFILLGQGLIQVLGLWLDDYTAASLLAAAILTVPSFFANKHFVWRDTARENLYSQVLMFWVTVMLAVSLATLITYLVENAMADQTMLIRGAAVLLAQLLGYGIVFIGRFLILDRWLFKLAGDAPEHVDEVVGKTPI